MKKTIKELRKYFKNLCIFTFVYIAVPMIFIKSGLFICSGKISLGLIGIVGGYLFYSTILRVQKNQGLFD